MSVMSGMNLAFEVFRTPVTSPFLTFFEFVYEMPPMPKEKTELTLFITKTSSHGLDERRSLLLLVRAEPASGPMPNELVLFVYCSAMSKNRPKRPLLSRPI